MNKDNSKVPIAVLSCFLIAFILQGILKISGVFIFEKALDWEIFDFIDKFKILNITYYSIIMIIPVYCLSFILTDKCYSKKWYHYLLIILSCYFITWIRLNNNLKYSTQILLDIIGYVIIPFVVNITTEKESKLLNNNLVGIVLSLSIQITFYFCYLGLTYWSSLLNSLIVINPMFVATSRHFLIFFEVYIGIIISMISSNLLIKKIKGDKL